MILSDLPEDPSVRGDPSIHGVSSAHGDRSTRENQSARGDPPVRGDPSIRGIPTAQEARSVRGDPSIRAPSSRGNRPILGDPSVQGSVKPDVEDVVNVPASDNRSTLSHSNVNDIRPSANEAKGSTDQERNQAQDVPGDTQTSPPHTQSVEGMKIEEALQATDEAYKKAVEAGAPQLSIICGPGKNLRKRLVRMLEDQHGVSPSPSTNPQELVVPLPSIPPAAAADFNP